MITKAKNRLSLSCQEKEYQSFLSCALRYRKQLPSVRNLNPKTSPALNLSCGSDSPLESHHNNAPIYRAKTLIIGIDPGLTGAIAIISSGKIPTFQAVFDMPVFEQKAPKGFKKRVDLTALSFLIESYSKDIILALVEEVGQIGTKADPFSAFVFGFATGAVHGSLSAHGIKIQTVHPLVWKSSLGLDKDKQKSLDKAVKFFPAAQNHLKRKMDHGRAEALLLAYWGNQFMEKNA